MTTGRKSFMANNDLVGSLARGFDILKLVGSTENGLKSSEIMALLNLKAPTCYNLLRTMVACGVLEKQNNRFYLGEEIVAIARKHSTTKYNQQIETELLTLYQKFHGATTIYSLPGRDGVKQTHRISADRPGVVQHLDSESMHPYASAAGLIYLAFNKDEESYMHFCERFPFSEFGMNLWKSREALENYLEQVRVQKYAVALFDRDVLYRLSAAVLNKSGDLIGVVGLALPLKSLDKEKAVRDLRRTADRISKIYCGRPSV